MSTDEHGMYKTLFVLLEFSSTLVLAQTDTTRHGWPLAPLFSSHPSTGVFCEFRNTLTSDHFHNGVDIPSPDGSPAYSVYNGVVTAIGTVASQGDNAYVRVQYNVSGLVKSDAYVHIAPNPLLIVGDSVRAYQTVLGTILPGLGHVHFTHGTSPYMNGIRPVGGLTPYIDNYPPQIRYVKFFLDGTNTEFPANRVSGNVDIRVHVAETSASQPSELTSSTTNNGTYIIGYKILSADRSTEVHVPPANGVRFRFDRKPLDAYVANVFATGSDLSTHIYTITNGNGADDVNATLVVNNNAWNTTTLPVGNYTVMVFTQDTRALADTEYVSVQVTRQDLVAPAPPTLLSVLNDSTNRITLRWAQSAESDLLGYRLQFSANGTTWTTRDNETRLTRTTTSISYPLTSSGAIYFRLVAVDSASPPNVSLPGDVYGMRINSSVTKTLVVDGFDRTEASGSWHEPAHPFAMIHGQSVPTDFSTCANEEVVNGNVNLASYDVVVWILGDESTADETFSSAEQLLVQDYLRNGGKLLVSGSEVAWDLDRPSGPTQADRDYLHNFLKARYAGDDANEYAVSGDAATIFSGISLRYGLVAEGSPYEEDWPDFITPEASASVILHYGGATSTTYAGVAYRGMFPGGSQPGGVVYIGFPFETITTKPNRDTLMARVYRYFEVATDVDEVSDEIPVRTELFQNYPNPFNPTTTIGFKVQGSGSVVLKVFDILGKEVATLVNEELRSGSYSRTFDGSGLASGVYFYRLEAGSFSQTRRLLLLK
jgi:hypothetical protein